MREDAERRHNDCIVFGDGDAQWAMVRVSLAARIGRAWVVWFLNLPLAAIGEAKK